VALVLEIYKGVRSSSSKTHGVPFPHPAWLYLLLCPTSTR